MGALRKVGKIVHSAAIFIQAIPAAFALKAVFTERFHRANLDTIAALFTGFMQAGFFGLNKRMFSQCNLTHQATQPAGTPDGRDQHVVDAEAAQVHEMRQMLMRPARHQFGLIKVVGSRRQTGFISPFRQPISQGLAQAFDEIVGLNIGNAPISAGTVPFSIFFYQFNPNGLSLQPINQFTDAGKTRTAAEWPKAKR